jgi:Flp pilus assembly protein TadB
LSKQAEWAYLQEKIAEATKRERRGFILFVAAMLLIVISVVMIVSLPLTIIPVAVAVMSACLAVVQNHLVKLQGNRKKRLINELESFAFKNKLCPQCGKQLPQGNPAACPFCGYSFASPREQ